jgi:biopolymer transport protein ExbB
MTFGKHDCRGEFGSRLRRMAGLITGSGLGLVLGAGLSLAQVPASGEASPGAPSPVVETNAPAPAAVSEPATKDEATGQDAATPAAKPVAKADEFLPSALPHDLSPWGMFRSADRLVQAVMIGLAFASVVTWTVWLAKTIELWLASRAAKAALEQLAKAQTLRQAAGEVSDLRTPVARLVAAATAEADRSKGLEAEGVKERASVLLSRIEARAGRNMTRGTGVLATIGATAPFVGLFGTVWGIMNSFIGISQTNTTNLAVVAPGIAEALLATALGLVAAIPAVVIYNVFARSIAGYRAVLADATAEVLRHLSRDLDRAALGSHDEAKVVRMRQPAE